MQLDVLGIGTAQPEHWIEQPAAAEFAAAMLGASTEHARTMHMLYRRSGVERRGSVLLSAATSAGRQTFFQLPTDDADRGPTTADRMLQYSTEAPALAVAAAERAMDESGVLPEVVTHLITVSCTGFGSPGFDVVLIEELGLSPDVARTHIGFMGCQAALNALRVAAAFISADPRACVLVCCAELCSLHFQYGQEADNQVSNALFADGAAAIVCGSVPTVSGAWRLVQSGSHLFDGSQDLMTWEIGNNGFVMKLSNRVPEVISRQLRSWFEPWLRSGGVSLSEVGSWAIHPGGPRLVSAVGAALELRSGADAVSRQILAECGNMSSPTVLFILQQLRRQRAQRPCVALAFGPGLAVEAALFR